MSENRPEKRRGLGRGLGSLIPTQSEPTAGADEPGSAGGAADTDARATLAAVDGA